MEFKEACVDCKFFNTCSNVEFKEEVVNVKEFSLSLKEERALSMMKSIMSPADFAKLTTIDPKTLEGKLGLSPFKSISILSEIELTIIESVSSGKSLEEGAERLISEYGAKTLLSLIMDDKLRRNDLVGMNSLADILKL